MPEFPYHLNRTVVINAKPETVFGSSRIAHGGRAGGARARPSTPAGRTCVYPASQRVESLGEVLDVRDGEQIIFTYGFASGKPIAPGSSRVTIQLEPDESGTRLQLLHEFLEAGPRDEHVQGWRFPAFAVQQRGGERSIRRCGEGRGCLVRRMDRGGRAGAQRSAHAVAAPEIRFRDRFSLLDGISDLSASHCRSAAFYARNQPAAEGRCPSLPGASCSPIGLRRAATGKSG